MSKGKLPSCDVVARLLRFGFTYTDIADRFDVSKQNVRYKARKAGIPPGKGGMRRPNGARPTSRYFG